MLVQATLLQAAPQGGRENTPVSAGPAGAAAVQAQATPQPPVRTEVPDAADIQRTVQDVRNVAEAAGSNLQFSIDQDSGKTVVKVVDANTREVIRQIPSEELLDLARNMTKLEGMLLNQKA